MSENKRKGDNLLGKVIVTARNHIDRAAEGRELLKQGKSLKEMKTPITGLSPEETNDRRLGYLAQIEEMDVAGLQKELAFKEEQLSVALGREDVGSSELEWQRNAIRARLGL